MSGTTATLHLRPPAGATPAAVAGQAMREHVAGLTADLDAAHRDGLAIPPKVAQAVQVLAGLAAAWTANGLGRPAPQDAKRVLGLAPRAVDECHCGDADCREGVK